MDSHSLLCFINSESSSKLKCLDQKVPPKTKVQEKQQKSEKLQTYCDQQISHAGNQKKTRNLGQSPT